LRQVQPDLADSLMEQMRGIKDQAIVDRDTGAAIRMRALRAARQRGGDDLEAVLRPRGVIGRAVAKLGDNACLNFLAYGQAPSRLDLPDAVLSAERKLYFSMAERGLLAQTTPSAKGEAMVPGEVMGKVIRLTGWPAARVHAAMKDHNDKADRCVVNAALITSTLGWKGKERAAILKIL
jgi:hypothetical protein